METVINAAQNLVDKTTINGTNHTVVTDGMNNVFFGLSAATFVVLSILLLILSRKNENCSFLPYSNGLLFFCLLVTFVADLSMAEISMANSSSIRYYNSYTLFIILWIGILGNIIGSRVFFRTPNLGENPLCGINHASIGILIWGITVPLCLMEMLMAFCMLRKDDSLLFAFTIIATLFQKIIQVTIFYFGIRHKVPVANKHGTSLFLKIIAIYNFAMWLQSIIEGNKTMQGYLSVLMDGTSAVLGSIYAALTIDYRLLCFLLFAELALEVDESIDNPDKVDEINRQRRGTNQECNKLEFRIQASEYTGCGYVTGLVLLGTQFINALQFLKEKPVTPVVNILGMIADVLVAIQGVMLLKMGKKRANDNEEADPTSKGVDVMVGLMGVVGIAFWILKFTLIMFILLQLPVETTDPHIIDYFIWNAAKFLIRIIGLPFQLYFFCKITNSFGCQEIVRNNRMSYFILPCLMLSQLSVFVNSAIDNYSSILEHYIEQLDFRQSMVVLYHMGEPLYLGFVLHVFFRFLIVNNNLRLMPAKKRYLPGFLIVDHPSIGGRNEDQEEQLLGQGPKFHTT